MRLSAYVSCAFSMMLSLAGNNNDDKFARAIPSQFRSFISEPSLTVFISSMTLLPEDPKKSVYLPDESLTGIVGLLLNRDENQLQSALLR